MIFRNIQLSHLEPDQTIGEDIVDAYSQAIKEWCPAPHRTDMGGINHTYNIAPTVEGV